jgi:hypothetical protein
MISDDELLDLPEDPELAFVQCERKLREGLFRRLEETESYNANSSYKLEYINHVVAVAKALELSIFDEYSIPSLGSDLHPFYEQFRHDVDHVTVQIRMRHARRVKNYSVALDPATKSKVRHHLQQIKEIVDRLEVSERKKEALYSKINALADEVDKDRTRFDTAMALITEVASVGGEAADRLEPVRKWIDSIARLLGRAKEAEDAAAPRLPAPKERKRIEPPRRVIPAKQNSKRIDDLDDEIPF